MTSDIYFTQCPEVQCRRQSQFDAGSLDAIQLKLDRVHCLVRLNVDFLVQTKWQRGQGEENATNIEENI